MKKTSSSQRDRLEKELKKALKQIDEEGLIFLLKQANVLLHNKKVEELNREIVEYESKKKKGRTENKKIAKAESSAAVAIESSANGKSFIIILGGVRKIFSLEEMRALVKICHASGTQTESSERLYRWISRNRTDVLSDVKLTPSRDKSLVTLYKLIVKTYKVRE